ncbi:MAG TPA: SRPBCC family protein [Burkholderiaceae bacterium]|nr:SRPBCC family protein [Burkholderiaceae bacterium]
MFVKVSLFIAIVVALVLLYASSKPDTFRVERAATIKAPADKIFPYINDLHQWDAWTPYNRDPAMKKTFGGSAAGKGATYAWEGNKEVGKGDMVITESSAPNLVRMDLHFEKPFEANNQVDFKLVVEGDSTKVTWGMDGKNNLISKVMGLFINMDNMIGKDFQVGLNQLKAVAEK